jgi:hypothetical protein
MEGTEENHPLFHHYVVLMNFCPDIIINGVPYYKKSILNILSSLSVVFLKYNILVDISNLFQSLKK